MSIDVGERLRFVRNRNKLSQRELAKRAGVTNSTISLIESNQMNPSVGALKRILERQTLETERRATVPELQQTGPHIRDLEEYHRFFEQAQRGFDDQATENT